MCELSDLTHCPKWREERRQDGWTARDAERKLIKTRASPAVSWVDVMPVSGSTKGRREREEMLDGAVLCVWL